MLAFLRRLFQREPTSNLSEEVRFHLDMEAAELERAGMPPNAARREARRRFGGVDRYGEELRDIRGARWIEHLAQDTRLAFRLVRRFPMFAATVVLTIALGVGANTAIFSAVDTSLLRPLPFADGNRLVSLWATNPDKSVPRFGVSWPDYHDWQTRTHSFTDMALYVGANTTLYGAQGPESVVDLVATRNFLDVIGVRPMLGRNFGPEDERGEGSNSVIISYSFWRSHFGGDSAALGKSLSVQGRARTIIGVLPPSARLIGPAFVGSPLDMITVVELSSYPRVERHAQHLFGAIGRLKPGVTLEQARADLLHVETQLATEFPEIAGWTSSVFYITEDLSLTTRQPLLILLAASGLLIIIACINVANLLLVRGAARAREIAVRQSLGASQQRLVSQLVVESVILAVIGGALGVLLAALGLRSMQAMLPFGLLARGDEMAIDGRVLVFALGLSVVTALAFALWPAMRAGSLDLARTIREGGQGSSHTSQRSRRALVVAEISLALVLVVSAGLVWQSLRHMLRVDPGFQTEHTVTAQVTVGKDYPDTAALPFYKKLLTELEARPGIVAAGATDTPPLLSGGGGIFTSVHLIGEPPRPATAPLMSVIRLVTPGLFKAMGMRVEAGHDFQWDEVANSIVLSETAAKTFWPTRSSVTDRQMGINIDTTKIPVIGVVNDTRQASLSTAPAPIVYLSMRRYVKLFHTMTVVVRGRGDVTATIGTMRDVLRRIDPMVPLYNVQTLDEIVTQSTAQPRLETALLTVFALAAMLLAMLGIYGVVSYSVAQRQREIGVRMALGAQRADVLRLVLREGAMLAIVGILIGIAGALMATKLIQSWLFEIGRADPATFGVVIAMLIAVALISSWLPARRATRVDPLRAIRAD